MLFNSLQYFAFLAVVLIAYYAFPRRWQGCLILLCSYGFYLAFDWHFGGLLLWQTLICYVIGLLIDRAASRKGKQYLVALGALFSFATLSFFKYYNFFADAFRGLFAALGFYYLLPHLNLLLPVGISFFTFQSFGYIVDVYREKIAPERNFLNFALFVAFFPQLVAGPIGRSTELLFQFKQEHAFNGNDFESGLTQIIWGLFKKVVIADRLALYVNMVYNNASGSGGSSLLLAAVFFAVQIYCDFSGYSDMAIGSARLFGIKLRNNFAFPYFTTSINDFWKRWHISLTSWFRDYLYIPLGGNRCSVIRWSINVMIVFLVSGLWHGASWTFVIWGGLHGALLLLETAMRGRKPLPYSSCIVRILGGVGTFVLVTIAWVFFRAPSLAMAINILSGIMSWNGHLLMGASQVTFFLNILLLLLFICFEMIAYWQNNKPRQITPFWRVAQYGTLLSLIALFGQTSDSFIYLQF